MTLHRQRPAHKIWRNWKRISFSSQMLWNKKRHSVFSAPEYDPGQEENVVLISQQKSLPEIPKIVWMYWHNDQLPTSMALNISKIRRDNPDHQVYLITQHTLSQWLPDLDFISSDLTLAHKSEIIRLELIHRYGGIGIDCSTLLFEDLAWVHRVHLDAVDGFNRLLPRTINPEFPRPGDRKLVCRRCAAKSVYPRVAETAGTGEKRRHSELFSGTEKAR